MRKCSVVITSRPTTSSHLHYIVDCRAEVLGFSEEDRISFIENSLQNQETIKLEKLKFFLRRNSLINALCYIPLNMSILLCLTKDNVDNLPETQTMMFEKFIRVTIVNYLKRYKKGRTTDINTLKDLPPPYDNVVEKMSQFAFMALQKDKLVFTRTDVEKMCPMFTTTDWHTLGLLKHAHYFNSQKGVEYESFHFLHFAIQEYMAAYHVASLTYTEQMKCLIDTFWSARYCNMWIMYVGITGGNCFVFRHFLTGNYFKATTWLSTTSIISSKILSNKLKCLHLLHCLSEAQDHELLSYVKNIFQGGILDLSHQSLSLNDVHTFAVLLLRSSSNKQWEMINLSHCNIDDKKCNILCEVLAHSRSTVIHAKTVDISYNNIHLQSVCKLCNIFKPENANELILSVDSLYDNRMMNVLSNLNKMLRKQINTDLLANWIDGMLMVTYVEGKGSAIVVYADSDTIECCHFNDCTLCEETIMKVASFVKNRVVIRTAHVALSCFIFVDNIENCILQFLSHFQLVSLHGSNLHSKGAYLLSKVLNVEYQPSFASAHHYIADYLSGVICHGIKSNSSYLETISVPLVQAVKHTIESISTLRTISISNNNIGEKAAIDIAVILHNNSRLQKLYVAGNNLNTTGTITILKALKNVSSLLELDISNNHIDGNAADSIATVLSSNSTRLQKIYMGKNNLGTEGIITIVRAMGKVPSLIEYDISSNNIGSKAAVYIADMLSHSSKLQHLQIGYNDIGIGAANYIAKVLVNNTNLQKVYIGCNNLKTSGIITIARTLWNISCLTEFDISQNDINSNAAYYIAIVLSRNTRLQMLYMSGNNLRTTGTVKIAAVLKHFSSLIEFTISGNKIDSEAAGDIAAALSNNLQLKKVDLGNNNLESVGVIKIVRSLQNISSLTEFDISSNNICSEAADDIAAFLSRSAKLQKLRICKNRLKGSGVIKIAKALQMSSCLTEFDISSNSIGPEAAHDIATVYNNNSKLKKIYMCASNLEKRGAVTIAKALKNISYLTELDISKNNIGCEAADDIAEVLSHNTKLQKLNIAENVFGRQGTVKIMRALHNTSSLRHLNVSVNRTGSNVAGEIAIALSYAKLKTLNIARNGIGSFGTIKILRALQNPSFLLELNISGNGIGSEAAHDIAGVLSQSTMLQKLDISNNNFGTQGAITIARALKATSSLIEFNLSRNNIVSEADNGIIANFVAAFYFKNRQKSTINNNQQQSLTEINVSRNNIGREVADEIATVLSNNTKLQKLHVQGNNFGTQGAIKLARALKATSSLIEFNFSSNKINSNAAKDIAAILSCNTKLQKVNIGNNYLRTSGVFTIATALLNISSLKEFDISDNHICISNSNTDHREACGIASIFSHNSNLECLNIQNNSFKSLGAIKIINALLKVPSLLELNISRNDIDSSAVNSIAALLSHSKTLKRVNMNLNNFGIQGAIIIARSLRSISSLIEFNISDNDAVHSTFEKCIEVDFNHDTAIKERRVTVSNFEVTGTIKIVKTLKKALPLSQFKVLITVKQHYEFVDCVVGLMSLSTQLKVYAPSSYYTSIEVTRALNIFPLTVCKVPHRYKFSTLYSEKIIHTSVVLSHKTKHQFNVFLLGDNQQALKIADSLKKTMSITQFCILDSTINFEAADSIAAMLSGSSKLQGFYAKGNNFRADNLVKIIGALHSTALLTTFNISSSNITTKAVSQISIVLSHNRELQVFCLSENNLNESDTAEITKALQHSYNLKEFTISNNRIGREAADIIAIILSNNSKLERIIIKENHLNTQSRL